MEEIIFNGKDGTRLDVFMTEICPDRSRSFIKKNVEQGNILVNGSKKKAGLCLKPGDRISYEFPVIYEVGAAPENIPLDILYEDEDIIVVNKPKGMVVHPAPGHQGGTLVNALMYHCGDSLSGINGEKRPGIVHRIDKDTTGVLVCCKNDLAHADISEQLKVHSINRVYYAIICGDLKEDEGTIDTTIDRDPGNRLRMAVNMPHGRHAVTHFRVTDHLNGHFNMIEARLETGRTHQIRVSMASIGHPVLADPLYGGMANVKFKKAAPEDLYYDLRDEDGRLPYVFGIPAPGQCLHAGVLGFVHPRTRKYMEFSAPLPEYFERLLSRIMTVD